MIEDKRNLKKFIFSNIDFKNVKKVLDLGCGNCDDLKLLKNLYPQKKFKLFGIDKLNNNNNNNNEGITYLKYNLSKTIPYPNETFDLIYSHNFLECIPDKKSHIKELWRLLKKNGQVVYSHTDWDSQILDGDNKNLIRNIFRKYAEWKQPWMDNIEPWLGRKLKGIFNSSNLFKGEIKSYSIINTEYSEGKYSYNMINSFSDMVNEKKIKQNEYQELLKGVKNYQQKDKFFYSITNFIYYGKKLIN